MQLVTSLNNPRGNLVFRLTDLFGRTYRQRSTFEPPEATSLWYFCHLCDCDKVSAWTIFTTCGYYLHRAQTTFLPNLINLPVLSSDAYQNITRPHGSTQIWFSILYWPNDVATITESHVYMCIQEDMHVLIVTQEWVCGLDIMGGGSHISCLGFERKQTCLYHFPRVTK
jgi:hypothetical protein